MKTINLMLLLSLGILSSEAAFSQGMMNLIKIPTRCNDNVREPAEKCKVKVECPVNNDKLTVNLTYTCDGSTKVFKKTVQGLKVRPPSGLVTNAGLYITDPNGDLTLVKKTTMTEEKVASPAKDAFFFINHDQSLLELTSASCGKDTMFIKGTCYKVKVRQGLVVK